jgi:Zn-dependent M28 family amino/carboxypeptidase
MPKGKKLFLGLLQLDELRLNMRNCCIVALCIVFYGCSSSQNSPESSITANQILQDVSWLASDEMQGRHYRSTEARKAAKYIADKWKLAGLTPLPTKTSMYLPTGDSRDSPNVAAMYKGTGDTFVLITAHYDHLKPRRSGKDKIYNGADDNASGTAALLAIAHALSKLQTPIQSSIVLVAFTGEEAGLVGSKYFANNSPIPLARIRGLMNLDMISRGEPNTIFLEGAPDAPRINMAIVRANKQVSLNIIRNAHTDWLHRSDQAPFLEKNVPCIFLSVEDHEDYHQVTDHTDKIIPELAAKTARLAFLAAIDLAHPVP